MIKIVSMVKSVFFDSSVLLFGLFFLSMSVKSESRKFQSNKVTLDLENVTIEQFINEVESATSYRFVYKIKDVDVKRKISIKVKNKPIKKVLGIIFNKGDEDFKVLGEQVYLYRVNIRKDKNSKNYVLEKISVVGIIIDEQGKPLPGVSILEKGTENGIISDIEGKFSLEVANENAILVVSFVGFETQEIDVGNKAQIKIILKEKTAILNEVVVTALGIKRERKELGYSFQDVKGDEIANNPTISIAQSLYGKVSGVNISQTTGGVGASSRVIIRGNNSINGNNQPLYIVDGVPLGNTGLGGITDDKSAKFSSGIDNGDGLSSLNIEDIENISVLKGGSATALYGERGANGVVVITTKKGKNNTFKIEFNGTTTFNLIEAKYKDYQTEFGSGSGGRLPNPDEITTAQGGTTTAWGPRIGTEDEDEVRIFDGSFKPYQKISNNIQDFFRTGITQNNNISLSGGGDNTTYRFSYGNLQNDDVIPNSGLIRNSYLLRVSTKIKNLSFDGKFNYIDEKTNNKPALADDPNNIGFSLAGLVPNFNQKWLRHYQDSQGNYIEWNNNSNRLNPYYVIAENSNISNKNRILGNFDASYKFADLFSFRVNAGIDRFNYSVKDFVNSGTNLSGRNTGVLTSQDITFQEYNLQGVLDATKQFGKYGVSVGIGANHRKSQRITEGFMATNMIKKGVNNLANFSNKTLSSITDQNILVKSIFSYMRANYNNYLFLDLTARNDWNSALATAAGFNENNNYSFFYPSASSSFIFSNALNIPSNVLSFGKFRVSWASTGKAPEQPYATTPFYNIGTQTLLGNSLGTVGSTIVPNSKLKPEISNTYEVGVDLSFLNNRLGIDLSYYNTSTKDQLIKLNTSQTSGYQGAWTNIGLVENTGIEALVTAGIFRNPNGFNWNMTLNFSKNNNKIISLTENTDTQVISSARWAGAQIVAQVDKSSSEIYGKKFLRSPDGQVIIGDNGLPKLTENFESLGKAVPDWIMGVSHEFSYKNISLKTSLDMKFGGYVYSMTNAYAAATGLLNVTVEGRDEYNAWVKQKLSEGVTIAQLSSLVPDAGLVVPGVKEITDANGNVTYEQNTRPVNPQDYWTSLYGDDTTPEPFIYDASYVKFRELSLGYTFSKEVLDKINIGIENVRISLVGRNLWTIYSNVPNIDPESTYTSGNGQGFEYGSLPYRRSYGFNLKILF